MFIPIRSKNEYLLTILLQQSPHKKKKEHFCYRAPITTMISRLTGATYGYKITIYATWKDGKIVTLGSKKTVMNIKKNTDNKREE